MFTGIVEQIGRLEKIEMVSGGATLLIGHQLWEPPLKNGDSVAVNGICFTVTAAKQRAFSCDALEETINRTTISRIKPGAKLNLERALQVGSRIGGHFVSGHVDGIATLVSARDAGRDKILRFECSEDLLRGMILKGSVACNGVSLTISDLKASSFDVNIVPFTWANTNLSGLAKGDCINIETDLVGKYVYRHVETGKASKTLNYDALREAGFVE